MTLNSPVIAVFGASQTAPDHPDWNEAVRCGAGLAAAGFAVATGGYGGVMEAVSRGASEAGGHVIGYTAPQVFSGRIGANEFVVEEVPAATLTERIHAMLGRADGAIALNGSIGTLAELVMAWNVAFVAQFSNEVAKPVVTVGERWRRIIADLTDDLATDGSLVTCVDNVDAAVAAVSRALGDP
jgi:uncharacterized protein (TIGR00725 family)